MRAIRVRPRSSARIALVGCCVALAAVACGGDSGATMGDPCDFQGLQAQPVRALEDRAYAFPVGAFTLARNAAGGLVVTHADAPGRALFELAHAEAVQILRARFTAQEHQGTFDVHEVIEATCPLGVGATARTDGANLWLEGHFPDGGACAGLSWQVRACQPMAHHLSLGIRVPDAPPDVAVRFQAASEPGERVFGLGEQFPRETLDHKGRVVPVLVQEQGIGRGEPNIAAVMEVLSPGSSGTETTTHHPVPHVLTSLNRSFLLDNTEYAVFDMTRPDAIDVRVHSADARIRVLHGESPLELVERLTEFTGRMRPPPAWLDEGQSSPSRDLPRKRPRSWIGWRPPVSRLPRFGPRRGAARRGRCWASRSCGTGWRVPAGVTTSRRWPSEAPVRCAT